MKDLISYLAALWSLLLFLFLTLGRPLALWPWNLGRWVPRLNVGSPRSTLYKVTFIAAILLLCVSVSRSVFVHGSAQDDANAEKSTYGFASRPAKGGLLRSEDGSEFGSNPGGEEIDDRLEDVLDSLEYHGCLLSDEVALAKICCLDAICRPPRLIPATADLTKFVVAPIS